MAISIFNKADGNLYVYDETNHAFVRIGGKHHYAVYYIVDYVGYELPSTFTENEAIFFELNQGYILYRAGRDSKKLCNGKI